MAKLIKTYKGFKIKETTPKDETLSKYWIFTKDDNFTIEWECDTLQEAYDFIDSY